MFKGDSCYPISPYEDKNNKSLDPNSEPIVDSKDQMIKILSKMNIEKRDLSFCNGVDHLKYIETM